MCSGPSSTSKVLISGKIITVTRLKQSEELSGHWESTGNMRNPESPERMLWLNRSTRRCRKPSDRVLLQQGCPHAFGLSSEPPRQCSETQGVHEDGFSAYYNRFNRQFPGLLIPPGALVWFRPAVTKYKLAKAFPRLQPGIFLGYELQVGHRWKGVYYVADVEAFRGLHLNQAMPPGVFKNAAHATRVVRIPHYEHWVFPLKNQYDYDNGCEDIAGLNQVLYDGPGIKHVDRVKKVDPDDTPLDTYGDHPAPLRATDLSGCPYNEDEIARARQVLQSGRRVWIDSLGVEIRPNTTRPMGVYGSKEWEKLNKKDKAKWLQLRDETAHSRELQEASLIPGASDAKQPADIWRDPEPVDVSDDVDLERARREDAAKDASVMDSYIPESEDQDETAAPSSGPPPGDELPFPGGKARRPRKKKGQAALAKVGISGLFLGSQPPPNNSNVVCPAEAEAIISGCSTDAGSDDDAALSETSGESAWQRLDDFSNIIEFEFQQEAPRAPPQPRGFPNTAKSTNKSDGPKIVSPEMKKAGGWNKQVARDFADMVQDSVPACPVSRSNPLLHREKIVHRIWPFNACVARPMSKKEVEGIPDAILARSAEWDRLVSKGTFDLQNVRSWKDVAARARQQNKTVHMGLVFGFCVQKNAELVNEKPKYKYRYVFQGNRVRDQDYQAAMFQDLGSSPATQEASKCADFTGCLPGNDVEQADAEQAYIQAELKGTETWVQLPPERVPPEWAHLDRPVVRLRRALYGHPDAGTYWEQKCDAHCQSVGFEPIPDWPSSYYHAAWSMLLIVYVDDFKLAGPKDMLPKAWAALRSPNATSDGLLIEEPKKASHFLGCTHEKGTLQLPQGVTVTTMTYNMEPFMRSCVDKYLILARDAGFAANLKIVPTPFIAEDHSGSPQGAPNGDGPTLFCPNCRHAFCQSQSVSDAEYKRTLASLQVAASAASMEVREAMLGESKQHRSSTPGGHAQSKPPAAGGILAPVAARILMKLLYGARMARFDLLRAICHLACFVTKWDAECDKKLHRLMCYVHSTYHYRLVGWVGDEAENIEPHVFADADLAGCVRTQRSTSGAYLCMRGPNTCFPISAASKRQGCVVLSTPEAELYAGFFALRMLGIPAVQFWSIVLSREELKIHFHEDNQTMIRVMQTGRNFSMRYTTRTARIPIAWMYERFNAGDIILRYEISARMAADIFTKAFTDGDKFISVSWLINVVDPAVLKECINFITYEEPDPVTVPDVDEETADMEAVALGIEFDKSNDDQQKGVASASLRVKLRKNGDKSLVRRCLAKIRKAKGQGGGGDDDRVWKVNARKSYAAEVQSVTDACPVGGPISGSIKYKEVANTKKRTPSGVKMSVGCQTESSTSPREKHIIQEQSVHRNDDNCGSSNQVKIAREPRPFRKSLSLDDAVTEVSRWTESQRLKRKIFIEICCEYDSELGKVDNVTASDILLVRVTEEDDFTKRSTVDKVIKLIQSTSGHIHYSSPCTASCPYNVNVNPKKGNHKTIAKIREHWRIHDKMWIGLNRVMRTINKKMFTISIEWSHRSMFHRMKKIQRFVEQHDMVYRKISGCAVGLTSIVQQTAGKPLCKSWGFWTNSSGMARAMENKYQCNKSHATIAVASADTRHSGAYTSMLAKIIHASIFDTTKITKFDQKTSSVCFVCVECSNSEHSDFGDLEDPDPPFFCWTPSIPTFPLQSMEWQPGGGGNRRTPKALILGLGVPGGAQSITMLSDHSHTLPDGTQIPNWLRGYILSVAPEPNLRSHVQRLVSSSWMSFRKPILHALETTVANAEAIAKAALSNGRVSDALLEILGCQDDGAVSIDEAKTMAKRLILQCHPDQSKDEITKGSEPDRACLAHCGLVFSVIFTSLQARLKPTRKTSDEGQRVPGNAGYVPESQAPTEPQFRVDDRVTVMTQGKDVTITTGTCGKVDKVEELTEFPWYTFLVSFWINGRVYNKWYLASELQAAGSQGPKPPPPKQRPWVPPNNDRGSSSSSASGGGSGPSQNADNDSSGQRRGNGGGQGNGNQRGQAHHDHRDEYRDRDDPSRAYFLGNLSAFYPPITDSRIAKKANKFVPIQKVAKQQIATKAPGQVWDYVTVDVANYEHIANEVMTLLYNALVGIGIDPVEVEPAMSYRFGAIRHGWWKTQSEFSHANDMMTRIMRTFCEKEDILKLQQKYELARLVMFDRIDLALDLDPVGYQERTLKSGRDRLVRAAGNLLLPGGDVILLLESNDIVRAMFESYARKISTNIGCIRRPSHYDFLNSTHVLLYCGRPAFPDAACVEHFHLAAAKMGFSFGCSHNDKPTDGWENYYHHMRQHAANLYVSSNFGMVNLRKLGEGNQAFACQARRPIVNTMAIFYENGEDYYKAANEWETLSPPERDAYISRNFVNNAYNAVDIARTLGITAVIIGPPKGKHAPTYKHKDPRVDGNYHSIADAVERSLRTFKIPIMDSKLFYQSIDEFKTSDGRYVVDNRLADQTPLVVKLVDHLAQVVTAQTLMNMSSTLVTRMQPLRDVLSAISDEHPRWRPYPLSTTFGSPGDPYNLPTAEAWVKFESEPLDVGDITENDLPTDHDRNKREQNRRDAGEGSRDPTGGAEGAESSKYPEDDSDYRGELFPGDFIETITHAGGSVHLGKVWPFKNLSKRRDGDIDWSLFSATDCFLHILNPSSIPRAGSGPKTGINTFIGDVCHAVCFCYISDAYFSAINEDFSDQKGGEETWRVLAYLPAIYTISKDPLGNTIVQTYEIAEPEELGPAHAYRVPRLFRQGESTITVWNVNKNSVNRTLAIAIAGSFSEGEAISIANGLNDQLEGLPRMHSRTWINVASPMVGARYTAWNSGDRDSPERCEKGFARYFVSDPVNDQFFANSGVDAALLPFGVENNNILERLVDRVLPKGDRDHGQDISAHRINLGHPEGVLNVLSRPRSRTISGDGLREIAFMIRIAAKDGKRGASIRTHNRSSEVRKMKMFCSVPSIGPSRFRAADDFDWSGSRGSITPRPWADVTNGLDDYSPFVDVLQHSYCWKEAKTMCTYKHGSDKADEWLNKYPRAYHYWLMITWWQIVKTRTALTPEEAKRQEPEWVRQPWTTGWFLNCQYENAKKKPAEMVLEFFVIRKLRSRSFRTSCSISWML